jgi:hypothetical protein
MANEVQMFEPDVMVDPTGAILTTNHLGSTVFGDTAKDAQYLANLSGMRVFAKDRPGTGDAAHYDKRLAEALVSDHIGVTADWLDDVEDRLRGEGVEHLELFARSAASLLTLEIARTERLPVVGLCAIEMVGLRPLTVAGGRLEYARYQFSPNGPESQRRKRQKLVDEASEPNKPISDIEPEVETDTPQTDGLSRTVAMVKRQITDIRNNSRYWASTIGLENTRYIAKNLPEVTANFSFAEQPLAAPLELVWKAITEASLLRDMSRPGVAPFGISIGNRLTHSSFDDPLVFGREYKRMHAMVLKARESRS